MVRLYLISRYLRKHKLFTCLIFAIGLFLFFCNISFGADYTESNLHGTYNFTMRNDVLSFLYSTLEYKEAENTYNWFVVLNSTTNDYEIYFTPWSQQTPIQASLSYDRWHFNGTFDYIKYTAHNSNIDLDYSGAWTRTTGSLTNDNIYVYQDSNTSAWTAWNSQYAVYYYFVTNVGGFINFPYVNTFVSPTIDVDLNNLITGNYVGFPIYSGSVNKDEPMTLKFIDTKNGANTIVDSYILDENSPWFVSYEYTGDYAGQFYYFVTQRFMDNPLNIVNGNSYKIELTFPTANGYDDLDVSWTYNLTGDVQQNIQDNVQQDTLKQVEQTNAFLNSDKIDDSDIQLPEMEADDFTFSFFSTAVTSIVDAMNSATSNESITVEFRGTTYTINSSDFNFLRNNGFTLLRDLLPILWIFSIGFMIYKDAHYRIQKLKEFNWHAMFTDDIQVDML